jgi:hypothetical protein
MDRIHKYRRMTWTGYINTEGLHGQDTQIQKDYMDRIHKTHKEVAKCMYPCNSIG